MKHYKVIILGSGPAGLTAAIYAARANLGPLVIGGYAPGGQLMLTTEVDNFPGVKSILGPELISVMREQAAQFGVSFIDRDATKIDLSKKPYIVQSENEQFSCDAVIIATGASARWLGVPGEERLIGKGVSSCATCDGFFFKDKNLIVIGGGDSAMEEALFLTKFAAHVTVVHRRDQFRASKIMQDKVLKHPKISVVWNSAVETINGDQKVDSVMLRDVIKKTTEEKQIDGVFVAIGHIPNTKIFNGQLEVDKQGYLKVEHETNTIIPGVFVAGDVYDHRYRQAITAAGSGCKAAIDAEKYLEMSNTQTEW